MSGIGRGEGGGRGERREGKEGKRGGGDNRMESIFMLGDGPRKGGVGSAAWSTAGLGRALWEPGSTVILGGHVCHVTAIMGEVWSLVTLGRPVEVNSRGPRNCRVGGRMDSRERDSPELPS